MRGRRASFAAERPLYSTQHIPVDTLRSTLARIFERRLRGLRSATPTPCKASPDISPH